MVGSVRFVELKELFAVGLFDAIREKAGELLSGATEKAGDLAADLPGAQEVQDVTQSATDVAGQAGDVAGQAGEFAGQAGEQVTGAAGDLGNAAAEALPEVPPEYRP